MTVKELREKLSQYPDDMEVKYESEMSAGDIEEISVQTEDLVWNEEIKDLEMKEVKPYLYLSYKSIVSI